MMGRFCSIIWDMAGGEGRDFPATGACAVPVGDDEDVLAKDAGAVPAREGGALPATIGCCECC